MNLAAALPHIHELVSGIAAYTYTSSRVNVPSAATTVQVVALYIQKFVSASMGEELSGSQTALNSRCSMGKHQQAFEEFKQSRREHGDRILGFTAEPPYSQDMFGPEKHAARPPASPPCPPSLQAKTEHALRVLDQNGNTTAP